MRQGQTGTQGKNGARRANPRFAPTDIGEAQRMEPVIRLEVNRLASRRRAFLCLALEEERERKGASGLA